MPIGLTKHTITWYRLSVTTGSMPFWRSICCTDWVLPTLSLPLPTYHLDLTIAAGAYFQHTRAQGPEAPSYAFLLSPWLSAALECDLWALFGTQTYVARRLLAVLAWLTGLLLLLTGLSLAGWWGTLAGGLTALYHLQYSPVLDFERILTEAPAAFWVALSCCLLVAYLSRHSLALLILTALSLTGLILTRANFLTVLPCLLVYLYMRQHPRRHIWLFGVIISLPVLAWSVYASTMRGHLVMLTTQGAVAFAETNNIDTLEGIGPKRWNQGGWNPGFALQADGTIVLTQRHMVQPGENGWLKGLRFWRDHLTQLPRLFYVKLRRGFWYNNGRPSNRLVPERILLLAIGFLFMALGFRRPQNTPAEEARAASRSILLVQLALLAGLFFAWRATGFGMVLIVWWGLFLLAWLHPYGDVYQLPFVPPVWFLAFVASHAITTMLFLGDRYHQPLDAFLMLCGLLGIFLCFYELAKRGAPLYHAWRRRWSG